MTEKNQGLSNIQYIETTSLPDDIPKVDEVGSSSAPLKSAAFFIGNYCKDYNDDFILCKNENNDPTHCLKEGRKVTRCAIDFSRLQVQKDSKGPGAYKGSRDAIIKILMSEGVSGLYSEFIGDISVKQSMIASSIAGAATVLITNPIWVVNTRVTTRTLETIINIFDNDGISAFWQGVTPALILVINPIIQYTAFEQLKSRLEKIKTLKNSDFFILGAISKLVATTLTYPYIVMKSRMQLRQTSKGNGRYHSVLDGIKKIIESEGIKGLYKGISSKLLQSLYG
ncbi:16188_t:CDS:2 [Entrophospora sp. SA101]|nr:16177_t:CDS:2 [Entrophospora sp. SA101]CAJ0916080.1 16184_t:CDS:2 [Entrophospora sp. SA101]CAJ0916091.1 16188_t:CDS:2 [Entrophospora sp. SA101]